MLKKVSIKHLLAAYVILFFGLMLFWSLFRFFDHDEFEVVHTAWKITTGKLIYWDFFQHHHPLLYYLCAPVIKIIGENIYVLICMRLFIFILTVGIFYTVYLISIKFFNRDTAVISFLLLSSSMVFLLKTIEIRPDVPQTLLSLIAILLILKYFETKSSKTLVVASLLLAISFLFLQKTIFLIFLITMVFLFKIIKKEMHFNQMFLFFGCFFAVIIPYICYLLYTRSINQFIFFNWILNMNFIIRYSPIVTFLYNLKFNGLLCLFYIGSLCTIKNATQNQKILAFFSAGLILALFANPIPLNQDYMLIMPLVCITAARGVTCFIKNKRLLLGLAILAMFPTDYFLIAEKLTSNSEQLNKINYVLSVTTPSDYVYDGDIQFNLYRPDINYFWFCVPAIATYRLMTGYDYNLYNLIQQYKPKVISSFFLIRREDKEIFKYYLESEKYSDIFIRKH